MINSIHSYIQPLGHRLVRLRSDPRTQGWLRALGFFAAGGILSATALGNVAQPVALGFVLSCRGLPAVLAALGGAAGSFLFWGSRGLQCAVWLAVGLGVALLPGKLLGGKGLISLMAGVIVAGVGLFFQLKLDDAVSVPMHLLRILIAIGSSFCFLGLQQQDPQSRFLSRGLWVLALAQIAPFPWLGLGYIAAGVLTVCGSFPTAILGGLALDLAKITPLPVTAVACLGYALGLIPRQRRYMAALRPSLAALLVMALWKEFDIAPLPGLLLGGILGSFLPGKPHTLHRKTETGMAQVRLELAAGVFRQVQQLLLLSPETAIDAEAVLRRAVDRCCGSCPWNWLPDNGLPSWVPPAAARPPCSASPWD